MRKPQRPAEPRKPKKLEVRRDKIRELTKDELDVVAGGYPKPTLTGNCYY